MSERKKPHLIRGTRHNSDGSTTPQTVRVDALKTYHTLCHETLPTTLIERAATVYWKVGKLVTGLTLEKWLDGFRYDENPDKEIAVWEHIAATLSRVGGPTMSDRQKVRTAKAINMISIGTVDVESQTGMSDGQVSRLREAYAAID